MFDWDAFTSIGTEHFICQDYALAEDEFLILSDGCSSARQTDWGSRLLVQAVRNSRTSAQLNNPLDFWFDMALIIARSYSESLMLPEECLRATLLYADALEDRFRTAIFGDGMIVARSRNQQDYYVISHEFSSGAPYYPAYNLGFRQRYEQEFAGSKLKISEYWLKQIDGELTTARSQFVEHGFEVGMGVHDHEFPFEEYDLVALLTDGVHQFVSTEREETSIRRKPVAFQAVLQEVLAFKGYAGSFVQRRCKKAFHSTFQQKGWRNMDDFSIGVLHHEY